MNGLLYFTAVDNTNGYELWKSDGTKEGTVMVKDINAGSSSSTPAYLTPFNSLLYFAAIDEMNGGEVWRSDGTTADTVMVFDIMPGKLSPHPDSPT